MQKLLLSAPRPGSHGSTGPVAGHEDRSVGNFQQWLPDVGETFAEQIEHFRARSVELKMDFQLVTTVDEAHSALKNSQ
jgi:hypothetical protein